MILHMHKWKVIRLNNNIQYMFRIIEDTSNFASIIDDRAKNLSNIRPNQNLHMIKFNVTEYYYIKQRECYKKL